MSYDEKLKVAKSFNHYTTQITSILYSYLPNNSEIYRIKNLISIAKKEAPLLIVEKSCDTLWRMREKLINRDEDYFLKTDFSSMIDDDEDHDLIENIIELLQEIYECMNIDEKNIIWGHIRKLLDISIEYRILIEDYE